jgi:hypothetical protein
VIILSGVFFAKSHNNKIIVVLVFITLIILLLDCKGNNEKNDRPEIFELVAPDFIPIGFTNTIYLRLSASDAQGLDDINKVFFTIENPDSSPRPDTSLMHDDGLDGDITNGDGIYSFGVTSSNSPQEPGDYTYHFIAMDNGGLFSETIDHIITIDDSPNPYVYDVITPAYIQNGFPDTLGFYISASDPQGLDDIDIVYFVIEQPDNSLDPDTAFMTDDGQGVDTLSGDGVFSYGMAGPIEFTQVGTFIFHFGAIDQDGHNSNIINETFLIDNTFNPNPYVYNLIGPDSLLKGSSIPVYYFVDVWDPQGADDIDSVYYWVRRPDGTSNGSHYAMYDDGELLAHGDSIAADGIYSAGSQAPGLENQSGNYTFYFTAWDNEGNQANTLFKIITAYDGLIMALPINPDKFNFKYPNPWMRE